MKNVLFTALVVFILAGCQSNRPLIIPISTDIEPLIPNKVLGLEAKTILSAVYSPLFELRGTQPEPKLVASWTYDPIEQTYSFALRDNVRFHDGSRLTVDDVIFSIHQWASAEALDSHLLRGIVGVDEYQRRQSVQISGIRRLDNRRFSIRMTRSDSDLTATLCLPRFVIIKNNFGGVAREKYFEKPIGTGPFLVDQLSAGRLELSRFSNYFAKKAVSPRIIIEKSSFQDAIRKFNKRELDLLLFYSLSDTSLIERKDVVVEILPPAATTALVFPQNVTQHRNLGFRQYVLDHVRKTAVLDKCFETGQKDVAFLPPGFLSESVPESQRKEPSIPRTGFEQGITVFVTRDVWTKCAQRDDDEVKDGVLTLKSGQINVLYEQFKKGQLGPFVESFSFKNDDPMTVLQYFEPNTPEYLLAEPIAELTWLFGKIRRATDGDERNAYANRMVSYLQGNRLVVPLGHPKNVRVYADTLVGVSQSSIYHQSQNWESLGY